LTGHNITGQNVTGQIHTKWKCGQNSADAEVMQNRNKLNAEFALLGID